MFEAVGDFITMKWVREHPMVTTSAAVVSAAYSYARFTLSQNESGMNLDLCSKELNGQSGSKSVSDNESARAISWGDECGGKLEHVRESPQVDEDMDTDNDEPVVFSPMQKSKSMYLEPKCLKEQNTEDDCKADDNDSTGTNSPQWGWFVTFTPPQNPMFESEPEK